MVSTIKDVEDMMSTPYKAYEFVPGELTKAVPHFMALFEDVMSQIKNPNIWKVSHKDSIIRKHIWVPLKKCYTRIVLIKIYRHCIAEGLLTRTPEFDAWIRAKAMRSNSGIVNLTFVFRSDLGSCEMDCDYCPFDQNTVTPAFERDGITVPEMRGITRSYLLGEPAVDRAMKAGWNPELQFASRADQLSEMGHDISKLEIILEGGTFHSYDREYRIEFIRDIYYAANTYMQPKRQKLSLEDEITLNQTALQNIIGLTIETRPDMVTKTEVELFRRLGVTRVQLGIQSIFDTILNGVNRRLPTSKAIHGIETLMQNGFKVDLHFMPDLPGTTPEIDMLMFQWICGEPIAEIPDHVAEVIGKQGCEILSHPNTQFRGDQWKVYPTMCLDHSQILTWYQRGLRMREAGVEPHTDLISTEKVYVPYGQNLKLIDDLLLYIATHCPREVRINRVIRDFKRETIHGGTDRLSLRNEISEQLKRDHRPETDIRAREVKTKFIDIPNSRVFVDSYAASNGTNFFISLESGDRSVLYGFCRLRFNHSDTRVYFECLKPYHQVALVRELHVYGGVIPQGLESSHMKTQHLGVGKLLMYVAEMLSRDAGRQRVAVIAGTGTRGYYAKLGYELVQTYMIKDLTLKPSLYPPAWIDKVPIFGSSRTRKPSNSFTRILPASLIIGGLIASVALIGTFRYFRPRR